MLTVFIVIASWLFLGYLGVTMGNIADRHDPGVSTPDPFEEWTNILTVMAFGAFAFIVAGAYSVHVIYSLWKRKRRARKLPAGPTGFFATLFGIKRGPIPVEKKEASR